jgi:membrane protein YqaA with SNARE-associated domain
MHLIEDLVRHVELEPEEVEQAPSLRSLLIQGVSTAVAVVLCVILIAVLAREPAVQASDWIVDQLGLWGIAIAVILADTFTFPVPPDAYLLAAVASNADELPILAVISVSSILAGNLAYFVGPLLQNVPILGKRIEKFRGRGELLFKKWGLWTVVVAALTPIPFSIVCWFAGIYKMPYRPFFIGTLTRFLRFALFYYLFIFGWTSA